MAQDRLDHALGRVLFQHSFEHRDCSHLDSIHQTTPQWFECRRCREEGTATYHLRMCLVCGEVGCCDSSQARHATRHHEETGHELIRSLEPREYWVWCYEDRAYLEDVLTPDDVVTFDLSSDSRMGPALRWAAGLSVVFGIGSALLLAITLAFLLVRGVPPSSWGFFDWTRGGPFEDAGLTAWRVGVAVALLASAGDVVIGRMLGHARRLGGYATLAKLPVDVVWVIGAGTPVVAAVAYAARLVLVVAGWRQLRH